MKKFKNCAFTMAGAGQRAPLFGWIALSAFTMAEILLSLTIIGVVAAITLPSLTGNINERTWNTQRKALYARMSQAISLMPSINNYGMANISTAGETFVTNGLSKVLKINNICDSEHLADCGIASQYTDISGTKKNTPKTLHDLNPHFRNAAWDGATFSVDNVNAVGFETANGESVIAYYNPICKASYILSQQRDELGHFTNLAPYIMCANFVYDLNGKKGPNTLGKDIGIITAFYATDSDVVAPYPIYKIANNGALMDKQTALSICRSSFGDDMRIPNINELSALTLNNSLTGLRNKNDFWSGTQYSSTEVWVQDTEADIRFVSTAETDRWKTLCVQR